MNIKIIFEIINIILQLIIYFFIVLLVTRYFKLIQLPELTMIFIMLINNIIISDYKYFDSYTDIIDNLCLVLFINIILLLIFITIK
jgi:hypothetical protein